MPEIPQYIYAPFLKYRKPLKQFWSQAVQMRDTQSAFATTGMFTGFMDRMEGWHSLWECEDSFMEEVTSELSTDGCDCPIDLWNALIQSQGLMIEDGVGLEYGLVARSTCHSCRGTWFDIQHPWGGSQPSVTPDPGDWMPSSDLFRHQVQVEFSLLPTSSKITNTEA